MPRLLLDTHVFLWWVDDSPELTVKARRAIADPANDCLLSVASCWEMAIKASLGKLRLTKKVDHFVTEQITANSFTLIDITLHQAAKVETLPFHHRDPFDRILVAQAMTEKLAIVSADKTFARYGVKVIW